MVTVVPLFSYFAPRPKKHIETQDTPLLPPREVQVNVEDIEPQDDARRNPDPFLESVGVAVECYENLDVSIHFEIMNWVLKDVWDKANKMAVDSECADIAIISYRDGWHPVKEPSSIDHPEYYRRNMRGNVFAEGTFGICGKWYAFYAESYYREEQRGRLNVAGYWNYDKFQIAPSQEMTTAEKTAAQRIEHEIASRAEAAAAERQTRRAL
jgi:hypothetical protein